MVIELLAGERVKGETDKAAQACNDFLRDGPGRTLAALIAKYTKSVQKRPPTQAIGTLKRWSTKYNWQDRASIYDAGIEAEKTQAANEMMQTGLALEHERVGKLKDLATFLWGQINEIDDRGRHPNVWVRDVKQIGGGEFAEKVEIERFNAALISEYRGVLDDLAKETSGRKGHLQVDWRQSLPDQYRDRPDEVRRQFAELLRLAQEANANQDD